MRNKKYAIIIVSFMILSLLVSACASLGLGSADPTASPTALPEGGRGDVRSVVAEGHVEPREMRYLSFSQAGEISEILVQQGENVQAGQALTRLADSEEYLVRLQAADLEIESTTQSLDELKRTAELAHAQAATELVTARQNLVLAQKAWDEIDTQQTTDDIEDANTDVADAEKALDDAQDDFEPYQDLPEGNEQRRAAQEIVDEAEQVYSDAVLRRDELVNALALSEAELELARQLLAEAQYEFDQTMNGADPDQLKLAELRLELADKQAEAALAALDRLELRAPFSGTILDINIVQNEQVTPANWALLLADTSQWYVRTSDLTELEVVDLKIGQVVEIIPDALSDFKLKGTVVEISDTFRSQTGDILYDVLIQLEEFDPKLKWGMTVEVNFLDE